MTLRTRLAALTTALLAAVLAASGIVLERTAARDVERSLEERVRQRARAPLPPVGERTAAGLAAAAEDLFSAPAGEPPPPPSPPPDEGEPPPFPGPPPPPPPPRADEPPPRSAREAASGKAGASARRALPPEFDGAFVAVLHFLTPGREGTGEPVLIAEATTGGVRVTEHDARAALTPIRRRPFELVGGDGTPWIVVQDLAPPIGPERGPPGPGGPRRPPPRRAVAIAFLDPGPARAQHRAFVIRVAGIGLGALFVGGFLAWGLAGRMLRPVRDAARAAEAIERPTQRLPAPPGLDELGRLVVVLNGMLGRLEAASNRERLFLATASHELRRPLTALLGELELASAPGRGPDELRSSLALARDDALAMRRLVEDLLHHARAQAGTLRLVEGEASLPELVSDAADRSRRSVPHPFALTVRDVPELLLRADPDLLRQALENLVVNAAVHGGVGVHVALHGEQTSDAVFLHVDDDGPGVSVDERETIFEPFGRGDGARTAPGFGLGLAIARDAVRAHGGELSMVSPCPDAPEGRPGARFTLRLPAGRVLSRS